MMTPEQLAAIQARAEAAQRGAWFCDGTDIWHAGESYESNDDRHFYTGISLDPKLTKSQKALANLEFCAKAREDIPALLDEVRRLQGQVEALASLVKEAYRQGGYREKNDPPKGRETYEDAFYYSEARLRLNAILNGAESEGGHGN